MNQVTQVNVLNGDVKFTYEDGSHILLNTENASFFNLEAEHSKSLPINFATQQRRLVYVANRFFN